MKGKVTVTKVGNCGRADKYIRIDRITVFGNPFVLSFEWERDACIEKYRTWFEEEIRHNGVMLTILEQAVLDLNNGLNINLLCHCAPKRCHGDVIKHYLESRL